MDFEQRDIRLQELHAAFNYIISLITTRIYMQFNRSNETV